MPNLSLEDLKLQIPESLKPWAEEYGPALLKMGAEGVKAFIEKLLAGDVDGAYQDVLNNMENNELLDKMLKIRSNWTSLKNKNADDITVQKAAGAALAMILLTIAIATVGL